MTKMGIIPMKRRRRRRSIPTWVWRLSTPVTIAFIDEDYYHRPVIVAAHPHVEVETRSRIKRADSNDHPQIIFGRLVRLDHPRAFCHLRLPHWWPIWWRAFMSVSSRNTNSKRQIPISLRNIWFVPRSLQNTCHNIKIFNRICCNNTTFIIIILT